MAIPNEAPDAALNAAPENPPQQEAQKPGAQNDAANRVALAGGKIIYDKKILPKVLQIMKSGDPAEGLAQATLFVMKALFEVSKGTMPPQAFLPAVQMLMPLIAELGEAAGILKADEATVKPAAAIFAKKLKAEMQGQGAPATPAQPPTAQPTAKPAGLIARGMGG